MFRNIVLFIFLFCFLPGIALTEEIPQRIDGRVVQSDEQSRTLILDFEHPATGEHSEMEFYVEPTAGLKDFKKLGQLKPGDLVSLDYLDEGARLKAIYVIRIPLEKTYFTHKEVAEALVKMKAKQKDPNIHDKS